MYYTYVLACKGGIEGSTIYIGSTGDLKQRIATHKAGGVRTTKKFGTIEIIYYEACVNKTDARKRELQLKTGFGRGYLKRRLEQYYAGLV
jgi:putative endonuclease